MAKMTAAAKALHAEIKAEMAGVESPRRRFIKEKIKQIEHHKQVLVSLEQDLANALDAEAKGDPE